MGAVGERLQVHRPLLVCGWVNPCALATDRCCPRCAPASWFRFEFYDSRREKFRHAPFVKGREEAGDVLDYLLGAGGNEVLLDLFARLISPFLSLLARPHVRTDVAGE